MGGHGKVVTFQWKRGRWQWLGPRLPGVVPGDSQAEDLDWPDSHSSMAEVDRTRGWVT